MAFKLGSETRRLRTPQNTPILKKNLGEGIQAEANNDGTIFVDSSIKEGSKKYNRAIKHEMQHMVNMETIGSCGKVIYL